MDNPFLEAEKENEMILNEQPFNTEEFGKLQLNDKVLKAFLYNNPVGTYLYTLEEGKRLSIYIIKGYINQHSLKQ